MAQWSYILMVTSWSQIKDALKKKKKEKSKCILISGNTYNQEPAYYVIV